MDSDTSAPVMLLMWLAAGPGSAGGAWTGLTCWLTGLHGISEPSLTGPHRAGPDHRHSPEQRRTGSRLVDSATSARDGEDVTGGRQAPPTLTGRLASHLRKGAAEGRASRTCSGRMGHVRRPNRSRFTILGHVWRFNRDSIKNSIHAQMVSCSAESKCRQGGDRSLCIQSPAKSWNRRRIA